MEITLKDEERTKCTIFSRIVGYVRPLINWHTSKQQEFSERAKLKVNYRDKNE